MDAGIFVEAKDVKGFALAILAIRYDAQLRKILSLRARQRAEQLAWPRIAEAHGLLYEELVTGKDLLSTLSPELMTVCSATAAMLM
jgi:hypothetical protein